MAGHGGSSAGSYLANPTSPIPSHCASIVATSTLRVDVTVCCVLGIFARDGEPKWNGRLSTEVRLSSHSPT